MGLKCSGDDDSGSTGGGLNQTIMGLKYHYQSIIVYLMYRLNQTIMGLKLTKHNTIPITTA